MSAPAINTGAAPDVGERVDAGTGAGAGKRADFVTVTVTGAATEVGFKGVVDGGAGKELATTFVDLDTVVD